MSGAVTGQRGGEGENLAVYDNIRWLLFKLDAEQAHRLAIGALRPLPPAALRDFPAALGTTVAGINFPSPVGLAAGFDKDAEAPRRLLRFGFGSVEVGTVTPRPQPGNPTPRMFRLVEDEAVINRFGFNNKGYEAAARRLARRAGLPGIIGVNIGANKDSIDKIEDYVMGVYRFSKLATYLTINISSPNTVGLRNLQSSDYFPYLVERVISAKQKSNGPPIFLKVSPDLSTDQIRFITEYSINGGIDAIIVANTTVSRNFDLQSSCAYEEGGLSGRPIKDLALHSLRMFRAEVGTKMPLIGVGGIGSAQDAYERIRAGASLIQLYTAIAYNGWGLAKSINQGLLELMKRDGVESISDLVGTERLPSLPATAAQETKTAVAA